MLRSYLPALVFVALGLGIGGLFGSGDADADGRLNRIPGLSRPASCRLSSGWLTSRP